MKSYPECPSKTLNKSLSLLQRGTTPAQRERERGDMHYLPTETAISTAFPCPGSVSAALCYAKCRTSRKLWESGKREKKRYRWRNVLCTWESVLVYLPEQVQGGWPLCYYAMSDVLSGTAAVSQQIKSDSPNIPWTNFCPMRKYNCIVIEAEV